MSLWTVTELAKAMNATRMGESGEVVNGVTIDSRVVYPEDVFFAIKGETHDGHDFVLKALDAGATVAVVNKEWVKGKPERSYLVVDDVLEALRLAGKAARKRTQAKIFAITGSVGKTSTKETLREVLAKQGRTHAAVASFNNHWGVPLTLARMPANTQYGIFEIGMNHSGEIVPLVALVEPHIAIVTNVEGVHLAHFRNVEEIADAKAEIFTGIVPNGVAIINKDNAFHDHLMRRAHEAGVNRVVSFGEHKGAEARLENIVMKADCSLIDATILGQRVTYRLGAPGRHLALNSVAVLAATSLAEADLALAAMALGGVSPVKGRGARIVLESRSGQITVIDESYNANPVSMRAALAVLAQAEAGLHGRRIAVIGDMLELGPQSDALHAALADAVIANRIDLVFCCGKSMHALWTALPMGLRGGYAVNSIDLQPKLLAALNGGDVVMVKGSLGSRMGPVVDAIRKAYNAAPRSDAAL